MYWIDPIGDQRWTQLVERHPQASVFHTASWLEALRRTYGYQPTALTSSPPGAALNDGIAFCEVKSWISGSRLVSLPFSDHCQPLLESGKGLGAFAAFLTDQCGRSGWEYVEIRPTGQAEDLNVLAKHHGQEKLPLGTDRFDCGFEPFQEYYLHRIDLRPGLNTVFSNFHKSCIQRKIQRAEREGVEYEVGRSESTLRKFYQLLLLTRRRHGLPPQPLTWFRTLKDCLCNNVMIRIALKDGQPIAGVLTLLFKSTIVYKYGCSDAAFHSLGAMPMLFWKTIQEAQQQGATGFDLGRSDIDNQGLIDFKEHLGALCFKLTYFRLGSHDFQIPDPSARLRIVNAVFARMPGRLAQMAGRVIYRHIG